MEWQQLHYFSTLAKIQHMTRAAEELSISQPALSRSIARLEEELGVPLFDRHGRGIYLNHFGQSFLKRVKTMRLEYDRAILELQELNNPDYGMISLGFLHTLGTNVVPDLLRDFGKRFPHVHFKLTQNYSYDQLKLLQAGELDVCLLAAIDTEPPVVWQELWRDELFIMVPSDHPLAERTSVTLHDVADEPFIHLKEGYALRKNVERCFGECGITPHWAYELDEVSTIAGFVAAGLGITLLPHDDNYNPERVVLLPVKNTVCERIIGMAWLNHKTALPAAIEFKKFASTYFQ